MSIQYPLTLPVVPNSFSLDRNSVNTVNISPFTLQQQVVRGIGEAWFLKLNFAPVVLPADAVRVGAFMSALRCMYGTFYFGPPRSRLDFSGTSTVTLASINNDLRDNITCNLNGVSLTVGTYIQIGSQLCQIAASSAVGTYDIFPSLRTAYAAGTTVNYTNPIGIFRQRKADGAPTTFNADHTDSFTIEAMEAL